MAGIRNSSIKSLLRVLILSIPVIMGLFIVDRYGVNVAFWDEWEFYLTSDHFFSWDFLWGQHNEHRIFFPKLLSYLVGSIFSWNSKSFMYLSQLFIILLYSICIYIQFNGKRISAVSCKDVIVCLVIGLLLYNPCQWENLLWGFQTAWFMIVSLGSLSFLLFARYLHTGKKADYFISLVLIIIVSFSSLHGLAICVSYLGIVILAMFCKTKLKPSISTAVILLCICVISFYFVGWSMIERHSELLGHGKNMVFFFFSEIGNPLLAGRGAKYVGVVFALLTGLSVLFIIREKKVLDYLQYIGPIIMSVSIMLFIAIGRGNSGVASRYTTNSILFLVFSLMLVFRLLDDYKDRIKKLFSSNMSVLIICCVVLLLSIRSIKSSSDVYECYKDRVFAKAVLANYDILSEECEHKYLYSFKPIEPAISYLSKNGYNTFSDDLTYLKTEEIRDVLLDTNIVINNKRDKVLSLLE